MKTGNSKLKLIILFTGSLIITSKQPRIEIQEVAIVDFAFETHKNFTSQQLDKPWIVISKVV
jgi:hypothetical protein